MERKVKRLSNLMLKHSVNSPEYKEAYELWKKKSALLRSGNASPNKNAAPVYGGPREGARLFRRSGVGGRAD